MGDEGRVFPSIVDEYAQISSMSDSLGGRSDSLAQRFRTNAVAFN